MQTMSDQIDKISAALIEVQKEISNPQKTKVNPFYKSNYADLPSVLSIARDVLPKHDLAFTQMIEPVDGESYLVTMILHKSGQWLKSFAKIVCKDPLDPQKFGSSLTYFRRYGLQAMIGVVGDNEDDDGNGASQAPKEKPKMNDPNAPIDKATVQVMESYLQGHDDIKAEVLRSCQVSSLDEIKNRQMSSVSVQVKRLIKKKNGLVKENK